MLQKKSKTYIIDKIISHRQNIVDDSPINNGPCENGRKRRKTNVQVTSDIKVGEALRWLNIDEIIQKKQGNALILPPLKGMTENKRKNNK